MDTAAARNHALTALTQREYSRKQLLKKLIDAGADPVVANAVLDEMSQLGYLNHQRYTEALINKRMRQGYGPRWIRQELQQAGIESEIVGATLEEGHDWCAAAASLYRKKYANKPVKDLRERAKRTRFMFSKGFASDHLRGLLQVAAGVSDSLDDVESPEDM